MIKYSEVNLIHLFFSGPLLIYIGLAKPQYDWIYWLLFLAGVYVVAHFLIGLVNARKELSSRHAWYFVHILVFVPLLLYVGWKKAETPPTVYSLLLAVGIAAFGYHLLRLVQKNV